MQQKKIAFIGGGNMASAIVFGLLAKGYVAENIRVCEHNPDKHHAFNERGVFTTLSATEAIPYADVILLAVKPQNMEEACQAFAHLDLSNKWIISIAAGISVSALQRFLPTATQFVRVMPNTPALISKGMSGLFATSSVTPEFKRYASDLFAAVGQVCWVENEADINTIIAASGSSPAYFFLFMESMQKALLEMGLTEQQARLLVQQSALGAAEMVIANPQTELEILRQQVTSKGGTTAAAINVFQQQNLEATVKQAMQAAIERAEEMEKLF
ncbi:pyrroline-5-carboxylate reductase [Gallibacterium trehalosifermentans]|uniref:Pyrroline-5-carboxylate reductase n=1 Tax=Gallibacterium trehalosifermentans TaxID=516935 RepID=A0ABV6GZJ2_9PAST